jgi:hypothetical protein
MGGDAREEHRRPGALSAAPSTDGMTADDCPFDQPSSAESPTASSTTRAASTAVRQTCLVGGIRIVFLLCLTAEEQVMTQEDPEETVPEFSDELSDEALDRAEAAFCSCRSSFVGDN